MNGAIDIVNEAEQAGFELRRQFFAGNREKIVEAALRVSLAIARGGKLLICGNGGSAADAQHIAGEFVNRFLFDRPALPAISLVTDTSVLTAIGNDSSFDQVFARQIEALGRPGDALLAISTSGKSPNVLNAMDVARQKGLFCIGLCGANGFVSADADLVIAVPSTHTPCIQEQHLVFEHLFCRLTDYFMFENPAMLAERLQEHS